MSLFDQGNHIPQMGFNEPQTNTSPVPLPRQDAKFHVTNITFVETGTYAEVYNRPYKVSASQGAINDLHHVTVQGKHLTPDRLSHVAGSIIRPSTNPQAAIMIPGGWGQKRFRFILQMETMLPGAKQITYISGWTDVNDYHIHYGNRIILPPELCLYFSGNITVIETMENVPGMGLRPRYSIQDNSQYISNVSTLAVGHNSYGSVKNTVLLRPTEVINNIHSKATYMHHGSETDTLYDLRNNVPTHGIHKSVRHNVTAPSYMSRTLDAIRTAAITGKQDGYMTIDEFAEKAISHVQEPLEHRDNFINNISRSTNFLSEGFITWGDLCRMSPGLDNPNDDRLRVFSQKAMQKQSSNDPYARVINHEQHSQSWNGRTHEVVISTMLTQGLPAIMMDCFIGRVHFIATNKTHTREFEVSIVPSTVMNLIKGTDFIARFIERLKIEVLYSLLPDPLMEVELDVFINIYDKCVVTVKVGMGQPETFTLPMFCESMFSPIYSHDVGNLQGISSSIETIADGFGYSMDRYGSEFQR